MAGGWAMPPPGGTNNDAAVVDRAKMSRVSQALCKREKAV